MNPAKQSERIKRSAVLLTCSMVAGTAAQERVAPAEPFEPLSSSRLGANEFISPLPVATPGSQPASAVQGLLADPLQWGPFRVRPHADYRFTYATDIHTQPGVRGDTAQHAISPGVAFQATHITVDYTPTLNYYTTGDQEDHLDHSASLSAAYLYRDWQFALSHVYNKSGSVTAETATQVDRDSHNTILSASRRLGERFSLDLTASQSLLFAEEYNSTRQWSTMEWLNYIVSDKTTAGIGLGFGYDDVSEGTDMMFEQIMGRVTWVPGPKLSLSASGGVEIRQFLDTELSDRVNPLMSASLSYQAFEQTTLSLMASRSVDTSLLSNQITESASVSASVAQRLFGHVNARLSGGFRTAEYEPTVGGVAVDRSDDSVFVGVSAGVSFLERGRISVGYHRTENTSSDEDFSYGSNQYTFHVGYHF